MPYRRILLAVDPDGLEESTLPVVAALARAGRASVTAVGVSRPADPAVRRAALEEHLQRSVDSLHEAGIEARPELHRPEEGSSVADEIAATAEVEGADLVVLGSHGRGALAAVLAGSTGREVAARVQAAVLFVHARGSARPISDIVPSPLCRLLVPVDYSNAARQALRVALDLAPAECGTVLILHVRELVPSGEIPYIESADEAQRLVDGLLQQSPVSAVRLDAEVAAPEVNPAAAIVKAGEDWNADLIVLGSRRLTAVGGLLLGSVAQGVLRRTGRPVLMTGHPSHEPIRGEPTG
jgi:nucleotide-binding universal stress UspA family protein